ncbi:hypothetical protein HYX05_01160 [Candidatus Woesearchaeota archaeon]|nr:hypothetical protein [Candidatus Woesearchaeota archaeon]
MNQAKQLQNKIINRIESELLLALFDYVAPFLDKKIKPPQKRQRQSNLENIVNQKPKIDFKDLKELESLIFKNLNENVKANKNVAINQNNVLYSLNLRRQKNKNEKSNKYSISIKYEENESEDKLKITVKKDEKELYSSEITNKKDAKDRVVPYSVKIFYEDGYAEERLSITYRQQLKNYLHKHIEDKEDITNRVPLKWLNILPESMMGGVLGFTYLGENFMGRRADLTGKTARMVDIHESIHTPDEYETRVLTSWMMEKARTKYVK